MGSDESQVSPVTELHSSGYVVFVTGVPSSGKSIVSKEIRARSSSIKMLSGDELIRSNFRPEERIVRATEALALLLDETERLLEASNLVVEISLPASHVRTARARFGGRSMFVILRVSEDERRRRERKRSDRVPISWWTPAMTELGGPDGLYDLVVDSGTSSPGERADEVIGAMRRRWPDIAL